MFKGLGNFASIMKQAKEIGGKMEGIQKELEGKRVKGAAGGGMVEVECNGLGQALRVTIDPDLIAKGDWEMIQELLPAAINQASNKAKQLHAEAMQSAAGGMPGLDQALAAFTGGDDAQS